MFNDLKENVVIKNEYVRKFNIWEVEIGGLWVCSYYDGIYYFLKKNVV